MERERAGHRESPFCGKTQRKAWPPEEEQAVMDVISEAKQGEGRTQTEGQRRSRERDRGFEVVRAHRIMGSVKGEIGTE